MAMIASKGLAGLVDVEAEAEMSGFDAVSRSVVALVIPPDEEVAAWIWEAE